MACPLPARASYRDLLRDLVGQSVTVRPGPEQSLGAERPAYLAAYRYDDGGVAALAVLDQQLALAVAAALGMMPTAEADQRVADDGRLDEELQEFLHEVVNVAAKLLNRPASPHVVLRELLEVPGPAPTDVVALATEPRERHDWLVHVDEYGEGLVTLLA